MAFDGAHYLVVWGDERGGDIDVYGTRVDPDGTILDPAGFPISTAVANQYSPSLAFGERITWSCGSTGEAATPTSSAHV